MTIVGLMSGSSLDGVDLAVVRFFLNTQESISHWSFVEGTTVAYSQKTMEQLRLAPSLSGESLWQLHVDLGRQFGDMINSFLSKKNLTVDYIASHGHTVFHHPETKMTCQIGDGGTLSVETGLPVISDFRSMDVAGGGQGAPLAPLADTLLYPQYRCFLNLGGIANVHIRSAEESFAYDVCPCNQLLNYFSEKLGKPYDDKGKLASFGMVRKDLLAYFNSWAYYNLTNRKSLGNSDVRQFIEEADRTFDYSPNDFLRTGTEHIANRIAAAFTQTKESAGIFSTGGGVFNSFLIELLSKKLYPHFQVVIPDREIVEYKEAILMALAGLQRIQGKPIFLKEWTGSAKDSFGGAIYWNNQKNRHDE